MTACSFCGESEVPIVAGPGAAICDRCIWIAVDAHPTITRQFAKFARAHSFAETELIRRRHGDYDGADFARQAAEQITSRGAHRAPWAWEAFVRRDSDRDEDWRPFDGLRVNPS